jgi:hypothetical protein
LQAKSVVFPVGHRKMSRAQNRVTEWGRKRALRAPVRGGKRPPSPG